MSIIDAHVHVWPASSLKYPLAQGWKPEQMAPPSFTPDKLFEHCTPAGVSHIVLIQMSYFGYDNSYMLDTIAAWPGIFSGVAVVDPKMPYLSQHLVNLHHAGVRGLRVQPDTDAPDDWLTAEHWRNLISLAGDLGIAICPLIDPEYLPAVHRAAWTFADTIFVVDHLGRVGCGRPILDADIEALCMLADVENCFVKVSAFYALGIRPRSHEDLILPIHRVYDTFGPQRLMWASDCPFQVVHETYQDSLSLIQTRLDFLSDADRQSMLFDTAARVFFDQ